MWLEFFLCVICAFVIIYLPGFFLTTVSRCSKLTCFAIAPIISSLIYYLIAFLYGKFDIPCNWISLVLPIFCISIVVSVLWRLKTKVEIHDKACLEPCGCPSGKTVILYIFVSLIIAGWFFVKTLDGSGSIYQENDNIFHLTLIRDFLNSSNYSMGSLLAYPASWHVLVAIVVSFMCPSMISIAVNAVNFVLISVVFPVSTFLFLSTVFGSKKRIVLCGAFCVLAFAAFPWGFLLFGPLYPNLFAYSMLPAAMGIFVLLLNATGMRNRVCLLILFIIAFASLVFAHPNAVFVGIVILTPYCISMVLKSEHFTIKKKAAISLGFAIFVIGIWAALYLSPLFSGVVSFVWPAYTSTYQAIINVLLISFTKASVSQIVLALVVIAGAIYCIVKKQYLWMLCSYLLLAIMLVVNVSTDGVIRHYLTGFWYTDEFRVASALAIAGIPIASIGLYSLGELALKLLSLVSQRRLTNYEHKSLNAIVAVAFLFLNFLPSYSIPQNGAVVETGFGKVNSMLINGNSLNENTVPFDQTELSFVNEVKSIIGDSKVLNFPYDGSAYAYAMADLNVVNRAWFGYSSSVVSGDSDDAILREQLNDIAYDPDVLSAASSQNISYVLLLDQRENDGKGFYDAACDYDIWQGLLSVSDDTPGFEIVLSEGDMRLYRITGA